MVEGFSFGLKSKFLWRSGGGGRALPSMSFNRLYFVNEQIQTQKEIRPKVKVYIKLDQKI